MRVKDTITCEFIRNVQMITWETLRGTNVNVAISISPAEDISEVIFSAELIDPESLVDPDIRLHSDGVLLDVNSCLAEFHDRHFTQISQKCTQGEFCENHYVSPVAPSSIKNFFPTIKISQPNPVFDDREYDDFLPDLAGPECYKINSSKVQCEIYIVAGILFIVFVINIFIHSFIYSIHISFLLTATLKCLQFIGVFHRTIYIYKH